MLKEEVRSKDLIISTNPAVTHYYLGRVDGFLRQKRSDEGQFSSFEELTDEYNGIPLIDSRDEIDDLLRDQRRVWVILDKKINKGLSREARSTLELGLQEFYKSGFITTYTNCIEPECEERRVSNE